MKAVFKGALLVGAVLSGPAFAAQPAAETQEKISRLIVYGSDPCPKGSDDEIVVCARRPDSERYRIPENLREPAPGPEGDSWAVRAEALEYVGRSGIQSCSPNGPGGFTGCWEQMMRAARQERRAAGRVP